MTTATTSHAPTTYVRWLADPSRNLIGIGQVNRFELPHYGFNVTMHFGWLTEQHIHRHIDWNVSVIGTILQHQLALFGRHPHHCKRTALTFAK